MVLEKSDLVSRVLQLVEDEKKERERAQRANDEEEEMYRDMIREAERESRAQQPEGHDDEDEVRPSSEQHQQGEQEQEHQEHQIPSPPRSPAPNKSSFVERNGLCVVCQDEEANIAIIDCGCVFTLPFAILIFMTHETDTSPCAEHAQISSCLHRASVLYVGLGLSPRHDYYVYSNHKFFIFSLPDEWTDVYGFFIHASSIS